jgi:hypothetical protein
MRSRAVWRVASIAAGAAGILGAHALDYFIVAPNGGHRHELLLQTGHGYWPHAIAIGLVAGVLAALASLGSGFASSSSRSSYVFDASILALVQVGAFVSLEAVERLGSGRAATVLLGPLLIVGVVLQIVVAAFAAAALRALAFAGSIVAKLVRARARRRAVFVAPEPFVEQIASRWRACAPIRRRGPPLLHVR